MADISKIKIPSGDEYNFKDATSRTNISGLSSSLTTLQGRVTTLENDEPTSITNSEIQEITGNDGGSSAQTSSGTITGGGSTTLQISCNFEPDLIYVCGNLSSSNSLRGIISVLIVKDSVIYKTADTSQSNTTETMTDVARGITGYGGYATLSNNVLTIDAGSNTSSNRFASNISYSYTLIKWT